MTQDCLVDEKCGLSLEGCVESLKSGSKLVVFEVYVFDFTLKRLRTFISTLVATIQFDESTMRLPIFLNVIPCFVVNVGVGVLYSSGWARGIPSTDIARKHIILKQMNSCVVYHRNFKKMFSYFFFFLIVIVSFSHKKTESLSSINIIRHQSQITIKYKV